MLLTIDIETLPSDDDAVRAELAATILPPGSMSKAETISAWTVEKKPALIDEAMLKTSFDAQYGRILCIGWAVDDAEPQSIIGSEDVVLPGFMDALRAAQEYTIKSGKINADVFFIGTVIILNPFFRVVFLNILFVFLPKCNQNTEECLSRYGELSWEDR